MWNFRIWVPFSNLICQVLIKMRNSTIYLLIGNSSIDTTHVNVYDAMCFPILKLVKIRLCNSMEDENFNKVFFFFITYIERDIFVEVSRSILLVMLLTTWKRAEHNWRYLILIDILSFLFSCELRQIELNYYFFFHSMCIWKT